MNSLRYTSIVIFAVLLVFGFSGVAQAQDDVTGETVVGVTDTSSATETATTTAVSSGDATTEASGRPRLAVHTFENPPNYYNSTIGNGLTSIVVTHLTQSGRFNVIQRGDNLGLLIDEVDLGASGYIESDTAVEMGHIQGVEYILSGRVTNFGYEESEIGGFLGGFGGFGGVDISEEKAVVRLDFALIDATTGVTLLAATAEGKESETGISLGAGNWGDWIGSVDYGTDEFMDSMIGHATLKAVDSLMDQILDLFPVQAPILAVTPDFVILDIGSGSGIEEGMEFDVFRVSAVTNSVGEVVWEEQTLIGRVRVTEVELTGVKAVVISGSGFLEGDLCILPEDETGDDDDDDDDDDENPFR